MCGGVGFDLVVAVMITWGEGSRPRPQSMEERLRRALWCATVAIVLLSAAIAGLIVSFLRS